MNHDPTPLPLSPSPSQPSRPQVVTCPMCHTAHPSLTDAAVDAGDGWRCSRCGQQWDAERLLTVSAYEAWVRESESTPAPVASWTPHLRLLRPGS
jgi:hypothetical protein